jgi:hypothetical protein
MGCCVTHRYSNLLILFVVLLVFPACSSSDPVYKTGFLTDYSKLSPSPYEEAEKGTLLYENDELNIQESCKWIDGNWQRRI